jgi:hypothetical protein
VFILLFSFQGVVCYKLDHVKALRDLSHGELIAVLVPESPAAGRIRVMTDPVAFESAKLIGYLGFERLDIQRRIRPVDASRAHFLLNFESH